MNVTRTPAGLSNEHIFHSSEAVVYVEGGESSRTTVPDASTDVLFWRGLFDKFVVGHRFHFKPRCGKQTLLALADGIADGTISAVIVCLDRDHDHLRAFGGPQESCTRAGTAGKTMFGLPMSLQKRFIACAAWIGLLSWSVLLSAQLLRSSRNE